jgi:NAD-dependent SIR2 family protein deacetylase
MSYKWAIQRTKPYMQSAINRLKCSRCGAKAHAQWNICADKGYFRPICKACDIALNDMVLRWFGHPNRKVLMSEYRRKP